MIALNKILVFYFLVLISNMYALSPTSTLQSKLEDQTHFWLLEPTMIGPVLYARAQDFQTLRDYLQKRFPSYRSPNSTLHIGVTHEPKNASAHAEILIQKLTQLGYPPGTVIGLEISRQAYLSQHTSTNPGYYTIMGQILEKAGFKIAFLEDSQVMMYLFIIDKIETFKKAILSKPLSNAALVKAGRFIQKEIQAIVTKYKLDKNWLQLNFLSNALFMNQIPSIRHWLTLMSIYWIDLIIERSILQTAYTSTQNIPVIVTGSLHTFHQYLLNPNAHFAIMGTHPEEVTMTIDNMIGFLFLWSQFQSILDNEKPLGLVPQHRLWMEKMRSSLLIQSA